MAKITLKFNQKAFEEIRRSQRVADDLNRRAARVAAAAGDGFEARGQQGVGRGTLGRYRTSVTARSRDARKRAAQQNALVRALDAGR